ncbi:MAG: site-specific DNA-methyltransferase [bacterium]
MMRKIKEAREDYRARSYLSAVEAAKYLDTSVAVLHNLVREKVIDAEIAASGQMRFDIKELKKHEHSDFSKIKKLKFQSIKTINEIKINDTVQKVIVKNSMKMDDIPSESVHLMITSPPYFNAKMYSREQIEFDLGNIHEIDEWFDKIGEVWKETFRVLQPGRKVFINIMNLPIREKEGFRTLNLCGRTVDLCEKIGFVFKRDIVWHKTNAVRAHFGTYPYPGGILINHMHEFILEFNKPEKKGFNKYGHLTKEQKERSKLDREFWVSVKKSDVWEMKPQPSGDRRNHVAPFPYELPYRLIKAFSYIGEIVLDPFLGSGTTLTAAADLRRNGIGYEINPEIALDAIKHLKNYQQRLFM